MMYLKNILFGAVAFLFPLTLYVVFGGTLWRLLRSDYHTNCIGPSKIEIGGGLAPRAPMKWRAEKC